MSEAAQALGQRLKAEREKRGMSAQKMADDMHLDAWVVDALEAGDYERIGPAVYAQGHLRKYASILGVSAAQEAPAPQAKLAGPPAPIPIIRLDPPGGGGSIWPTVGGVVVIALVAGGIAWWRPWHGSRAVSAAQPSRAASVPAPQSASTSADAAAGAAVTEAAKADGTVSPDEAANESAATYAGAPAASGQPAASPAGAATVAPAAPVELTPGVGRARLRLSFSADSRVAVYDYTGKSVFTGNGRANSVKTLSGMAPFRVYLGSASGVQLQVNDRAVAIGPQFVSGDVARFEAGADGVLRRDPHPTPAGGPAPGSPARAAPRG
jgi:cytoskeleton protein RodZ